MDYKEMIQERHEDLCFEFEETHDRRPTDSESLELYEEARWYVDSKLEAMADYARKIWKGE